MKKLIITLAVVIITATSIYSQSVKSISSSGKNNTKETLYSVISVGMDFYTANFKQDLRYGFNAGLRHQFSDLFYLEGKIDLILRNVGLDQQVIIAVIPQWSLFKNKSFNFVFGLGVEFFGSKQDGGAILPVGSAKFEYKLSDDFIIFPELRYPLYMASINIGYRVPIH